MFRLWARIFQDNRIQKDLVVCRPGTENRTRKIFDALQEVCLSFDLPEPIWLDGNIRDFRRHSHTRFGQDSFLEAIDFDYLEIRIIEED